MTSARIVGPLLLTALCSTVACSNGAASPPPAVVANTSAFKLQLGVGTATIATDQGSIVGTNFTMTFRGPDGNNATGVNTPTLTGPPSFRIGFPGSLNSLHGESQPAFANDIALAKQGTFFPEPDLVTSLGPYTGVFGYGMASDNLVSSQLSSYVVGLVGSTAPCTDVTTAEFGFTGEPTSLVGAASGSVQSIELPLPLGTFTNNPQTCPNEETPVGNNPIFGTGSSPFPIAYYGGPPSWPSPQGYGAPTYFTGFGLGFTDSPAVPVAGAYSLSVAYATDADFTSSASVVASAQLRTTAPLPVMPKPTFVIAADGSGLASVAIPPGLFEAIVIVSTNNCSDIGVMTHPTNYFSQVLHASGRQNVRFAPNLGPPTSTGVPSKTFCSSTAAGTVSVLGFDYPAYESSYPFDHTVMPKITNGDGHTGQADVTTSPPLLFPSATASQSARRRGRAHAR